MRTKIRAPASASTIQLVSRLSAAQTPSGVVTAQSLLKDPENTIGAQKANTAASAHASNDPPHLKSLEDEAARVWTATTEEPTVQTRRLEFYRGLQSFLAANPRFAVTHRYERLLQEVLAVLQEDQKRPRVRTVDDVFAVALRGLGRVSYSRRFGPASVAHRLAANQAQKTKCLGAFWTRLAVLEPALPWQRIEICRDILHLPFPEV